jgi:uncharacterized protein with HEPN domain
MSSRPIELYVTDIKDAIGKIEKYVRKMTFTDFKKDSKTVDAGLYSFNVGNAANGI